MGGDVTHRTRDSKLPVIKAEVHDGFRVPTHDAAASVRGEAIEYRGTHVFVSRRAAGLRDASKTPITQTLPVNSSGLTFDAFRK